VIPGPRALDRATSEPIGHFDRRQDNSRRTTKDDADACLLPRRVSLLVARGGVNPGRGLVDDDEGDSIASPEGERRRPPEARTRDVSEGQHSEPEGRAAPSPGGL